MTKAVERSERKMNHEKSFKSPTSCSADNFMMTTPPCGRRVDPVWIGPTSTVAASASASASAPTPSSNIHNLVRKMSVVSISPKQKQFRKMRFPGILRRVIMDCEGCGKLLSFWRDGKNYSFKIFDGVTTKDVPRAQEVQLICGGCGNGYEFPFPREHPIGLPIRSLVKKNVTVCKRGRADKA